MKYYIDKKDIIMSNFSIRVIETLIRERLNGIKYKLYNDPNNHRIYIETDNKLNNINSYSYFMGEEEDLKYGFLAGELESVGFDNLIKTVDNYKRINYQSFIPLLLEKIKQLEKRLNDLENS